MSKKSSTFALAFVRKYASSDLLLNIRMAQITEDFVSPR